MAPCWYRHHGRQDQQMLLQPTDSISTCYLQPSNSMLPWCMINTTRSGCKGPDLPLRIPFNSVADNFWLRNSKAAATVGQQLSVFSDSSEATSYIRMWFSLPGGTGRSECRWGAAPGHRHGFTAGRLAVLCLSGGSRPLIGKDHRCQSLN